MVQASSEPGDLSNLVEVLSERLATLEKRLGDLDAKAEIVRAASRSWRVHGQLRDQLVLVSDAGDVGKIPVGIARVIVSGRVLDLDLREDGDHVELLDASDHVVARLWRAAYLALPKTLAVWASSSPTAQRSIRTCVSQSQSQQVETTTTNSPRS